MSPLDSTDKPADKPIAPPTYTQQFADLFHAHTTFDDFPKTSLDSFERIDANKDGFLDFGELKAGVHNTALTVSDRMNLLAIAEAADALKNLSHDETFGESKVSKTDLQKYAELRKASTVAPDDIWKSKDSDDFTKASQGILMADGVLNLHKIDNFLEVNQIPLTAEHLDRSIDKQNLDAPTAMIAKQFKDALISGDINKLQQAYIQSKDDPNFKKAMSALETAFPELDRNFHSADLRLISTKDDGLVIFSTGGLNVDMQGDRSYRLSGTALVLNSDGTAAVKAVTEDPLTKTVILQPGDTIESHPDLVLKNIVGPIDTALRTSFNKAPRQFSYYPDWKGSQIYNDLLK